MCNHWRRPVPRRHKLSAEVLRALAADLAALGTRVIRYTGGEPTLRGDLPEIVAGARDAGIVPELNTHAMRIDAGLARGLAGAGLRRACVSMHADRPGIHDAIFGVSGAYERAWAGIDALRGAVPPDRMTIRLHTVVTRPNQGSLGGLPALAADRGVGEIHLQPVEVDHLSEPADRALALLPEEARRFNRDVLPAFLDSCRARGLRTNVGDAGPSPVIGLGEPSPQRTCFRPHYHVLITEEGSLYPCSQLNDKRLRIGNVLETPIRTLLDAARHREVLGEIRGGFPACRGCTWQLRRNERMADTLGILVAPDEPAPSHTDRA
jgi:AdoMet-dependent heme synthase